MLKFFGRLLFPSSLRAVAVARRRQSVSLFLQKIRGTPSKSTEGFIDAPCAHRFVVSSSALCTVGQVFCIDCVASSYVDNPTTSRKRGNFPRSSLRPPLQQRSYDNTHLKGAELKVRWRLEAAAQATKVVRGGGRGGTLPPSACTGVAFVPTGLVHDPDPNAIRPFLPSLPRWAQVEESSCKARNSHRRPHAFYPGFNASFPDPVCPYRDCCRSRSLLTRRNSGRRWSPTSSSPPHLPLQGRSFIEGGRPVDRLAQRSVNRNAILDARRRHQAVDGRYFCPARPTGAPGRVGRHMDKGHTLQGLHAPIMSLALEQIRGA